MRRFVGTAYTAIFGVSFDSRFRNTPNLTLLVHCHHNIRYGFAMCIDHLLYYSTCYIARCGITSQLVAGVLLAVSLHIARGFCRVVYQTSVIQFLNVPSFLLTTVTTSFYPFLFAEILLLYHESVRANKDPFMSTCVMHHSNICFSYMVRILCEITYIDLMLYVTTNNGRRLRDWLDNIPTVTVASSEMCFRSVSRRLDASILQEVIVT